MLTAALVLALAAFAAHAIYATIRDARAEKRHQAEVNRIKADARARVAAANKAAFDARGARR